MIFKEDSPNLKKDHPIPIIFSIILLMSFTSVGLLMLQLYANAKPISEIPSVAMAMAAPVPVAMAVTSSVPMPMAAPMASLSSALADSLLNNSS